MLHAQNAVIAFRMNMLKHILIVDFAGRWLFPTWVIPYLEIRYFIPRCINVGNQVAFGNLLVVDVEQDLA